MLVAHLLLLCASTVSLVWWVPQLRRVWHEPGAGVSVETWAASATNLFLWGLWAALTHQPVVTAVEWVQAGGSAAVVAHLGVTRRALALGGFVMLIAGLALAWPALAALAAVVSVVLVRLPQLIVVLRARGHHDVAQVSAAAWAMSAGSNLLWLAWSLVSHHPTMTVGATLSVLLSSAIAFATRHQRRRLTPPLTP